MDKDAILDRIEKYRNERGLTKGQLNDLAGFSSGMIYQWDNTSRKPTLAAIESICKAFGISLSEFFSEDIEETLHYYVTFIIFNGRNHFWQAE